MRQISQKSKTFKYETKLKNYSFHAIPNDILVVKTGVYPFHTFIFYISSKTTHTRYHPSF